MNLVYFKITLRSNDGHTIIYPDNYQKEIGDKALEHLYYEDGPDLKLLIVMKKSDDINIVRPYVEVISESDAKTISEAKETRGVDVNDESTVRYIETRLRFLQTVKGTAAETEGLSVDEIKSIDPDDPRPGFVRRKILADRIDIRKAQ